MRKTMVSVVAVLTMMVFATGSAFAAGAPKPQKKDIKGFLGGVTQVVTANGNTFTTYSSGGMNSDLLGRGTYAITSTQEWDFGAVCGGFGALDDGLITLRSEQDGSTLLGTFAGFTCEIGSGDNKYSTTLNVTIYGGTVRFVGATGSIAISGIETLNPLIPTAIAAYDDQSTMTGKITIPPAP